MPAMDCEMVAFDVVAEAAVTAAGGATVEVVIVPRDVAAEVAVAVARPRKQTRLAAGAQEMWRKCQLNLA